MLRCRGWRIFTNNREHGSHEAEVHDENGNKLAGPFATVNEAVDYVHAHQSPRPMPSRSS
jgi:hypothetical protein